LRKGVDALALGLCLDGQSFMQLGRDAQVEFPENLRLGITGNFNSLLSLIRVKAHDGPGNLD
jgi:hypothetical protein